VSAAELVTRLLVQKPGGVGIVVNAAREAITAPYLERGFEVREIQGYHSPWGFVEVPVTCENTPLEEER